MIMAAVVVWRTGWMVVDPIVSVLLGLLIVASSWRVTRASLHILIEGTPERVKLADVARTMSDIPGVIDMHDLRVEPVLGAHGAQRARGGCRSGTEPGSDCDGRT